MGTAMIPKVRPYCTVNSHGKIHCKNCAIEHCPEAEYYYCAIGNNNSLRCKINCEWKDKGCGAKAYKHKPKTQGEIKC
jgi:hypothetical protein